MRRSDMRNPQHWNVRSGPAASSPHRLLLSQTELRLSIHMQFHSLFQKASPPHTQPSVKFSPCTDFKSPACTVMENTLMPQPPPNTYWPIQTSWAQCTNPTKPRCNFQGFKKGESKVKKSSLHLTLLVTFLIRGAGLDLPAAERGIPEESHTVAWHRVPVHYCSYSSNRHLFLSHESKVPDWKGRGLGGENYSWLRSALGPPT